MTSNINRQTASLSRAGIKTTAIAAALWVATSAHAAQIVNTSVAAPTLAGANSIDAVDWMAESFVLSAASTVDSVAVQALDTDPAADVGQSFALTVYANVAGLPGLDFNNLSLGRLYSTNATYAADGWNGVSGLNWKLAAGTYWLAVETGSDPDSVTGFNLPAGAVPAPAAVAFYSGGTAYAATTSANAFGLRIDAVAAVPEPATWAVLVLGLGALALRRAHGDRRGRAGRR